MNQWEKLAFEEINEGKASAGGGDCGCFYSDSVMVSLYASAMGRFGNKHPRNFFCILRLFTSTSSSSSSFFFCFVEYSLIYKVDFLVFDLQDFVCLCGFCV